MNEKLTKKQKEVLTFIKKYIVKYEEQVEKR